MQIVKKKNAYEKIVHKKNGNCNKIKNSRWNKKNKKSLKFLFLKHNEWKKISEKTENCNKKKHD